MRPLKNGATLTLYASTFAPNTMLPSTAPVDFNDDLARRCFPYRFRRVGNPHAYLDEIGIEAILEFIYKGHMLIDVAEQTNVPLATLNRWAEHHGHTAKLDEAEILSAEGYLAEGQRRLRAARTDFELKKAKEMIRHAQFMAQKKDKQQYGDQKDSKKQSQMTYVFNIGTNASPQANRQTIAAAGRIIDSTANKVEGASEAVENKPVTLQIGSNGAQLPSMGDIDALLDSDLPRTLGDVFGHLLEMQEPDLPRQEAKPAKPTITVPRPPKPTPQTPDVGPFYDAEHPQQVDS